MKIRLNLLPEKRVKEIRKKNILRFIIWQEVILIIILVLFFAMVRGIDTVINLQLESLKQQISLQKSADTYKEIDKCENVFRGINDEMSFISKIQQSDIDWLNIFEKMNEAIPDGVTITSLKNDNYIVSLDGKATTRDRLITLKNNLAQIECFTDVDVPLNDIVLKNDIDFQLDFKVKKECLLKYGHYEK